MQFAMDGFTPERKTEPKDPDTDDQNKKLRELSDLSDDERREELAKLKDFFTDRGEAATELFVQGPPEIVRKKFKLPSGESLTPAELLEHNERQNRNSQKKWNILKKELRIIADGGSKSDISEMSDLELNEGNDADEGCDVCVVQLAPTLRF
jgi:hypothetical protein